MTETTKPAAGQKAPLMTRTRLRLVPVQDRLLLDGAAAQDRQVALWLTRGIALQLFQRLRAGMEKGSAAAGKAAPGWRQETLALEHAAILKTDAAKGTGAPWKGDVEPRLVTKIGTKPADGDRIQLVFFSGKDPVAAMILGSTPLHRFAALLALRIQQARWETGLDLSWLGKPAQPKPQAIARKAN